MGVEYAHLLRHTYQPLVDNTKETGLLLHKIGINTIRCILKLIPLHGIQSFGALSYVWDDMINKETLLLDGVPCPVTGNLYVALLHLRKDDED